MIRRRFGRREKNWLYRQSRGRCNACGAQLPPGWHADHVEPFSRGGATDLRNGQALCPRCNLTKGAQVGTSGYVDRPHQIQSRQQVELALATGKDLIFANISPGSGKTNNGLDAISLPISAGAADFALWLAPRINLCEQVEGSAEDFWNRTSGGSRVALAHRENVSPVFRTKRINGRDLPQNAYATTYASLMADPALHLDELDGKRFVLVLDEAQQLGADGDRSTQSTQVVKHLRDRAVLTYVMSGTATRSDGQAVFGATYGDPDPNRDGLRPLLADVEASYQQGVRHGYLRPFDFVLVDGEADWEELTSGDIERLRLSDMSSGMRKVVWHPGYWQPMVDQAVDAIRDSKRIDQRFRGLIAAGTQAQAKEIMEYLRLRHRDMRSLLAVSDERLAKGNLNLFRPERAPYDVLVTVQMAYVGYDCPWILTVCVLNDVRWHGFLDQLFARALRVSKDVPYEAQTMRGIVPRDLPMVAYCERKRRESEDGLRERLGGDREGPGGPRETPLGYTTDAEATDRSAIGMAASGDVSPGEFEVIETIRKKYRLVGPITEVMRLFRDYGLAPQHGQQEPNPDQAGSRGQSKPPQSEMQREKAARKAVNNRFKYYDRLLISANYPGAKYGFTAYQWMAHNDGRGLPQSAMEDLTKADSWLDTVWAPWVEQATCGR